MNATSLSIKNAILGFVATIALMMGVYATFAPAVSAQNTTQVREGCQLTGTCTGGRTELGRIITNIVNILSILVGAIAVIMIIIGGLRYITSGGDSGSVASAKNTIVYAVVGIIIVVFAQLIVNFAITESTTAAP